MADTKRGTSPGTRKALESVNLKRKLDRLQRELAEISQADCDTLLAQSPVCLQTILFLRQIADHLYVRDQANELADKLQELIRKTSTKEKNMSEQLDEQEAQKAYQKAVGPDGNGRTANIINEIFQKMPGYKSQHPAVMMAVLAVAELWEIDPARARKIERGLTTLANLNRV